MDFKLIEKTRCFSVLTLEELEATLESTKESLLFAAPELTDYWVSCEKYLMYLISIKTH